MFSIVLGIEGVEMEEFDRVFVFVEVWFGEEMVRLIFGVRGFC